MNRPLWQEAASFAARAHVGHVRKDKSTPYIAHPFRVAMTVRDVFACDDPVAITAAILHDTIEDTPTDYDDIDERFGRDVADAVAALSKNMLLQHDQREPEYDARLANASWQARLVKLADAYDNYCDAKSRPETAGATKKLANRARRALAVAHDLRATNEFIDRASTALETLIKEADHRETPSE